MLSRAIDRTLFESYSDDISSFLKNIYAARGVSESQLDLNLSHLLTPKFDQLEQALTLLEQALTVVILIAMVQLHLS